MKQKIQLLGATLGMIFVSPNALAGDQVRVAWDKNPHSEAVIGFANSAGNSIKLGSTTDENSWQTYATTVQRKFDNSNSLVSNFVRLTNLSPDTEYYFKLCATTCSNTLYYFKTAPNSPRDMTVISGGDSRSSHDGRRQGNRLVAKIRPDYITFGGDYTNSNYASDMSTWLDHWQESFSVDTINGKTFRRVYPIIPTFGNHESGNPDTLCETFGTDPTGDGICTDADNYFAMNIGGNQTRVYTLNTEFKDNATRWSQQKTWLSNDLNSQGANVTWRLGQYHRSMVPTGGGKTSYSTIRQWAPIFESGKMNLITESDTHIVKYTWPVVPSGSSYSKVEAGTVYLGEGSWGVGTRSTDTPQSWLIDNASFKQFKIVQFVGNQIKVRTARFSGETGTSTLSRAARIADPLALPTGLDLWEPAGAIGQVYTLEKASNNLTKVVGITTPPPPSDTELVNGQAVTVPSTTKGSNVYYSLNVPQGSSGLSFDISGGSGDADLYVRFGSKPTSSSYDCRPYKNGNNENCTISSVQTGSYHVMLSAYASFSGVSLVGQYSSGGGGNPGGEFNKSNLSASQGQWLHHTINVGSNTSNLSVNMSGGSGDGDLYVNHNNTPSDSVYDCRPYKNGNNETCSVTNPTSGTWYLSIKGYSSFSGVSLNATWQ